MAARHWDRRVVDPVKRRWPVEDAPANRYSPALAGQLAAFMPGYSIDLESSYMAMSPTERRDFAADLMRETPVISGLAVADTSEGWEKAAHLGGAAIELPWLHGPGRGVGMATRSFRNVRNAADPGWHPSAMPGAFDKYRNLGPVGGSGTVWYADTPVIQVETILRRAQDQLDYLRAKRRWEKQWEALMGSSPRQSDAAPKVKTIPTAQPSVDFDQAAAEYLAGESPQARISTPRMFLPRTEAFNEIGYQPDTIAPAPVTRSRPSPRLSLSISPPYRPRQRPLPSPSPSPSLLFRRRKRPSHNP